MPKYKVTLTREITIQETAIVMIEADDPEEAQELASKKAMIEPCAPDWKEPLEWSDEVELGRDNSEICNTEEDE